MRYSVATFILSAALLSLGIAACKIFPQPVPVSSVEVYFSHAAVGRNYECIGGITAEHIAAAPREPASRDSLVHNLRTMGAVVAGDAIIVITIQDGITISNGDTLLTLHGMAEVIRYN